MILGEVHADHFMFQFENSSHATIENDANQTSFLWMNDLIVALFEFAKDLNVFDEHRRHQLKGGIQILVDHSATFERERERDGSILRFRLPSVVLALRWPSCPPRQSEHLAIVCCTN
jgi:hypothetical protein